MKRRHLTREQFAMKEIALRLPEGTKTAHGNLLPDDIAKGFVYEMKIPTKNERVSVSYIYMPPGSEILDHMHPEETEYIGEIKNKLPATEHGKNCAGEIFRNPKGRRIAKCAIGESHSITASDKPRIFKCVKITPRFVRPDHNEFRDINEFWDDAYALDEPTKEPETFPLLETQKVFDFLNEIERIPR